jgi:hypothetical protein
MGEQLHERGNVGLAQGAQQHALAAEGWGH